MKIKVKRLAAIRMIVSSQEVNSQSDLLNLLAKEGYHVTQATLSRDLKQLKVAKAASMNGNYVYVLPNETMYKRQTGTASLSKMLQDPGVLSINFSGNIGVIKTRPGYASAIAYGLDNSTHQDILGTIAGDDTILIVLREGADREAVRIELGLQETE